MTVNSVEVDPVFAEYLPETIEGEEDINKAFQQAALELHPDQTNRDTQEEFDTVRKARDSLKGRVDDDRRYKVETKGSHSTPQDELTLADISIEDSLHRGIDNYIEQSSSSEIDYDILDTTVAEETWTAVLEDNNSPLKIGLEMNADYTPGDEGIEVEASYFADGKGVLEEESGYVDIREQVHKNLGLDEWTRENGVKGVRRGIKEVGSWAVRNSEESLKEQYAL